MEATRRQIEMPDSWQSTLKADAEPAGAERPKFARAIVDDVVGELWRALDPVLAFGCPHSLCRRLGIVGGYRRGKTLMKDVELLIIPRVAAVSDKGDLFGTTRELDVTAQRIEELVSAGVLGKRLKCNGGLSAWGPWNKHAVHLATGLPVDLFFATAENWWNRVVVTTGPLESNVRIAAKARQMGWEWEVNSPGFVPLGGTWESCARERRTMRSEREVFDFVQLPYLPPEERK